MTNSKLKVLCFGAVGGAIIAAGVGMRWSPQLAKALVDPGATTWLSALAGTVIGGLISYFIALQSSRETLRRDEDSRISLEHASSLRAIVTAMQITNRTYTLNKQLEAAAVRASDEKKEMWFYLLASAGAGSVAPTFEPGDFIPFIKGKHADVVHRATLAAEKLASLEVAHDLYSSKRQEFQNFAERNTTIDANGLGTTIFTGSDIGVAKLKVFELDTLARQMLDLSRQHLVEAQTLCSDMNQSHQSYFGKKAGFYFGMDEGESPVPGS